MDARNYGYRVIENEWIMMSDGCRLAARIWLPDESHSQPVPAILEFLPYRKRGGTTGRDNVTFNHFSRAGYAGVRVDIRGNGESEGLMEDEYTATELSDGTEIIAWIAAQDWCDGNVGMIGHSWGGFNGLQLAELQPPALKAVILSCFTDDRYNDDIHYMGGVLNNDNTTWSQQMLAYSSRPPDPDIVGENWRDMWLHRLENMPLLAANWLRHQRRDAFWKHASVCENYSAVKAAVLAVGGWYDCYSNAIPRVLEGLESPAKGIIGPWEHAYPHLVRVTPGIDFLNEAVRWYDQWLKGIDNGADRDPALRAYLLEAAQPSAKNGPRQGHWVTEKSWPSPSIGFLTFYPCADGSLVDTAKGNGEIIISTPQDTGLDCGNFCPGMRVDDELPGNQQFDDAKSVVFETEPMQEPLAILGFPEIELELASDKPVGFVVARLCDVAPDGSSTRVSYNPLNLTQRESQEHPEALEPGEFYKVRFRLCATGYVFRKGHRVRLALSTTYWPALWPSPEAATLTLRLSGSNLSLPIRASFADELTMPAPPELPANGLEVMRAASNERVCERDQESGQVFIEIRDDLGRQREISSGLELDSLARHSYWIIPDDPLSAKTEAAWTFEYRRDDWNVRTETMTRMTSTATDFRLEGNLQAYEADVLLFEKKWDEVIPRDLM
jgi:putative CocE/NonD family hydrolase